MIREFLNRKYGKYVTSVLLDANNKVWYGSKDKEDAQIEVINHLKNLTNSKNEKLIPTTFLENNNVKWGLDFSSWFGEFKTAEKEYFFIGAEPHIEKNFQLVYDFGSYSDDLDESSKYYLNEKSHIWHDLINIFVEDSTKTDDITNFLQKCYITDLCHFVPQNCGQVQKICKILSIKKGDWDKLRKEVAIEFLLEEISIVQPKYIFLHGNSSRNFFQQHLNETEYLIDSKSGFKIIEGKINIKGKDYKIISLPHLKGEMTNKLWRCKIYPERPKRAKEIIKQLVKE